ncbi:MAG: isoprenylcysteine carboxylmethyltransferase family protein [Candidatus Thiothrix putei]|uniref:Protein-S-isoprenylcysteine O-methyltransferase Ste14 n=2 Tax=Thiothrix TaxID=1030 RepID=A0A1H3W9E1_9GAMM|nr:isoprenylcysteine carboxylmethyltransferase family protein [Thiothrix caldifontis]WGZ95131.1 MAG: isoprenylcysteine carboxylmethyltransferase family protein [Candidatus Thiothrix putei]SDZ82898.1 Protein-S-isoprenylcysteine O-methyltransferase Ste14 [Thiothrix caldifontis]
MNTLQLKIPPPVYLLTFMGVMWFVNAWLPLFHWIAAPWNRLGLLLIVVAVVVDFWSLGLFFRAHTTFNPIHPERTKALVTTGPYRYTRNPMYVGMLVILTGWGIWLGGLSPFLVLPLFVWVLTVEQIIPEEKILEQTFGGAYRDYKAHVRRWLW